LPDLSKLICQKLCDALCAPQNGTNSQSVIHSIDIIICLSCFYNRLLSFLPRASIDWLIRLRRRLIDGPRRTQPELSRASF
jgi:hypothetical protein